jgi:hypothetical protein
MLAFRRQVDKIYTLLGYYTVYGDNSLPKFRDNLSSRNVGKEVPLYAGL